MHRLETGFSLVDRFKGSNTALSRYRPTVLDVYGPASLGTPASTNAARIVLNVAASAVEIRTSGWLNAGF
jgi:hypothetical protein